MTTLRLRRMAVAGLILAAGAHRAGADVIPSTAGAYIVKQVAVVPCTPLEAFDAFTGDITPWWDHSFSAAPYRMYIEPKAGGRFVELFDSTGAGALHATVITVERGKLLRFVGPLGLAGSAVMKTTTCTFDTAGRDSCRITVEAHIAGEIDQKMASVVDGAWHHFLSERFAPYIRSGAFRTKPPFKP